MTQEDAELAKSRILPTIADVNVILACSDWLDEPPENLSPPEATVLPCEIFGNGME